MNNQPRTATQSKGLVGVIGIAAATLFLTYCLGLGTGMQKQQQVEASQPTPTPTQQQLREANRMGQMEMVYTVCNDSRMSATITEASCADLQDLTETEFLCEDRGTASDISCWVEDKSGAPNQPYLVYPSSVK